MLLAGALSAACAATAPGAFAGADLDAIMARGELICGVNVGLAGFSIPDSQGNWTGLDVDYCRAMAAALFGSGDAVKFLPFNAQQRFTALQSGEIDVLSRNTTWTLSRDATLGVHFAGVNYYDGQGFLVPAELGITSSLELDGATVCIQAGTTTELNLADYFRANGMAFESVVIESFEETKTAFFNGRCEVYTTDGSGLASIRLIDAPNPDDYVILPEVISKEPLGPAVRQGDDQFFNIAKWVLYALVNAEELGVTQANIDEMMSSEDPNIRRLLGVDPGMGEALGLSEDWAANAIRAVGNYGESFDRNLSPLGLKRGLNALWSDGGIMYAPPLR
jgi:general L-amino acid transport system substrate-binding protein